MNEALYPFWKKKIVTAAKTSKSRSWTPQNASNVVAWYAPKLTNGRQHVLGVESIYWDKMIPFGTLDAEQNSGDIIKYAVYKISATQANFFYSGCAVGDTFVCNTVKTCDANNKVQRYTGNHLTQPVTLNRPTDQIFNGVNSFLKTAPFTLNQPIYIYMLMKQITWSISDYIIDGNTANSAYIYQGNTSPEVAAFAGAFLGPYGSVPLNTWGVIRRTVIGAGSKLQFNELAAVTGNSGVNNMGGFTLAARGDGLDRFANIQVDEIVLANSSENEDVIYNYLKKKVV